MKKRLCLLACAFAVAACVPEADLAPSPQPKWYADADNDGYGDPNTSKQAKTKPSGYVSDDSDCNDSDSSIKPGATEIANDIDDDCDGEVDELALQFQSTVSATFNQGGGLPSGIAVDDTVTFSIALPNVADGSTVTPPDCSGGSGAGAVAFNITATQYELAYSSGYVQNGQIDKIIIQDCGTDPDYGNDNADIITFYNGSNDIYKVQAFTGNWQTDGVSTDFAVAMEGIDTSGLFDLTFYYGSWGNWGTYHYDYTKPQSNTLVNASTLIPLNTYFQDNDNDGYGDPAVSQTAISMPAGYVTDNSDCDDTDQYRYPSAPETYNGLDDDCDGLVDEIKLAFQSTVSATFNQGGGLPSGIAVDDSVTFSLTIEADTLPAGYSDPADDCYSGNGINAKSWTLTAVPYVLSYSSGYVQNGQIDKILIEDCGTDPDYGNDNVDIITFYNGSTNIYKVQAGTGTWKTGSISADFTQAMLGIDAANLFDMTFYYGSWGNWGTYHYDYTKPQGKTNVTLTHPN